MNCAIRVICDFALERQTASVTAKTISVQCAVAVDQAYTYSVPGGMDLKPGDIVTVPLGPREALGCVWDEPVGDVNPAKLRAVTGRIDVPPLRPKLMEFVDWVAKYTLAERGIQLADAFRRCLGGHQEGDIQSGLLEQLTIRPVKFHQWQIGKDEAVHSGCPGVPEEAFGTVLHDLIEIPHQHQGNIRIRADLPDLFQQYGQGHAIGQCLLAAGLDSGSIGQWIGIGYADLDEVDPGLAQFANDGPGTVQGGMPGREIDIEDILPLSVEQRRDPTHGVEVSED